MKQYLLSIYQPDGDPPPPEVLKPIMRDLEAVNSGRPAPVGEREQLREPLARRWPRSTALALVDELGLSDYHLFHAIRADLLRRLGRTAEAALAYDAAIAKTENPAERALLQHARTRA